MYKFYIQLDGDTFGPYSAKEMLDLDLLPDTMVTEESLNGTWYPASRLDFQDMYQKEIGIIINEDGTIQRPDVSLPHTPTATANTSNAVNDTELSKFNWGAFIFTWLWGVCNGVYWPLAIILLNFIPYVGQVVALILSIYLGVNGNKLAWESDKQWPSFQSFMETQKKWTQAIWWLLGACLIIGILIGIAES